jgi:hypothetical protein
MLGTLLEKLGTLLPKNFILANLFPMLLFGGINGLMLYWMSDRFRLAVQNYFALSAGSQALIGFPILIVITLAAYIFSTLNLFQREILEGRYLPDRLQKVLTAGQQRRADQSANRFVEKTQDRRAFRRLNGVKNLRDARASGNQTNAECVYSEDSDAAIAVAALEEKRLRYDRIKAEEFENALGLLEQELSRCPVDRRNPGDPDIDNKLWLNRDQIILISCLDYVERRLENDYVALFNKREFNFSGFKLAPTAMGNIAESVHGYARSRYSMNLDPFWSRLQKILIDDEKFYSTLVDAKTQLDFMISLFWVTVCFTIIWTIELLYLRRSLTAFVLVAIGGPVLSIAWYKIALQNYRAFADICRSAVDLYRFQLLDSLHVARPKGNVHERQTWIRLNQLIGLGETNAQVAYHYPPKS